LPKLPRLSAAAVVAAPKRVGFEEVRQKGSHLVLRKTSINPDGISAAVICVVPLHRRDLAGCSAILSLRMICWAVCLVGFMVESPA